MDQAADGDREHLPREKLARLGIAALGDHELLALVLGHGTSRRPASDIASAVLREVGGVHGLAKASRSRLMRIPGVGAVQASRLVAAVAMGRRTLAISPQAKLPLHRSEDLGQFLLPRFGAHARERFGVVLLDARHRLIRVHLVSEGTVDRAMAVGREVFREATMSDAAAVALFHNHPSGDPRPTRDDFLLTRQLVAAGRTLGIDVVDHLILADAEYCSMRLMGVFDRLRST